MNPLQQERLARFVDRESEMQSFCRMLDEASGARPVLIVWGESGMGKTVLLSRMMHECSLRSLVKAEVLWSDTRSHDYLGVMRKIRDDVGAIKFQQFTQLVNFFTNPQPVQRVELVVDTKGSVAVGEHASLAPSAHVDTMAGVVIRDLMLMMPRGDLGIPESERMARLTDKFIAELNAAAVDGKIVIFLDAMEKATELTQRWIWGELLNPLREGRLANVCFIVGRQNQPSLDDSWRSMIETRKLAPLLEGHIIEYLIKRGISREDAQTSAKWILTLSGGSPLTIDNAVDAVLLRMGEQDRVQ